MTCRVIIARPNLAAWVCSFGPDPDAMIHAHMAAYELEMDLDVERELGRWPARGELQTEPTEVEYTCAALAREVFA